MKLLVVAWALAVGCGELEELDQTGVCEAEASNGGGLCYQAPDGSDRAKLWCDAENTFVANTWCADLGYADLCAASDGQMLVFGDSPETCATMTSLTP
ncbi:MAG: hypothetical protein ABMA64_00795 [Myxococcota bacterium]